MMSGLPVGCPGDKTPVWITGSWPPETIETLRYQWEEVAIPKWKELVAIAKDRGIKRISLENHAQQLVYMQINEGCIGDTIRNYADQFGHIHVADAPGRHEPGTGEINYAYVFRTLEENGYEGLIGYELFPKTTTAEAVKAIMAVG